MWGEDSFVSAYVGCDLPIQSACLPVSKQTESNTHTDTRRPTHTWDEAPVPAL